MSHEIERKYLIENDGWRELPISAVQNLKQVYIASSCVVRISCAGNILFLSLQDGGHAQEAEIRVDDAVLARFTGVFGLPQYDRVTQTLRLGKDITFRLRTVEEAGVTSTFLTIKTPTGNPEINNEFEISVPHDWARTVMADIGGSVIEKTRHVIPYEGFVWQVDEFQGLLRGLRLAEVEVADSADFARMKKLPGAGADVTGVKWMNNKDLSRYGIPPEIKTCLGSEVA